MYLNAILSPPLGATTVQSCAKKNIDFVAILETSKDNRYDETGWVVQLWYQESGGGWQSADFSPACSLKLVWTWYTLSPN